jgi:hypothetical protein
MSMKKKGEPAMKPMSLHASLGHGGMKKETSETPKSLHESMKSAGGKAKGKGISMDAKDKGKTEVHIPSVGAMKKKVSAQVKGQKKSKNGK